MNFVKLKTKEIVEDDQPRICDIMKGLTPPSRILLEKIQVYSICANEPYKPHSVALSSFDYLRRENILVLEPYIYTYSINKGMTLTEVISMQMKRIVMSDTLLVDNDMGYVSTRIRDEINFALDNDVKVSYMFAKEDSELDPISKGTLLYNNYNNTYYLILGMEKYNNVGWCIGNYYNFTTMLLKDCDGGYLGKMPYGCEKEWIYDADNKWILDMHMNPEKMTDWTIIRNYNDDKLVEIIKLLNEKGKYRVV